MAPYGLTDHAAFQVFYELFWKGVRAEITASCKGTVTPSNLQYQEWTSHLKNLFSGDYSPYVFRGSLWPCPGGMSKTTLIFNVVNLPIILVSNSGQTRHWGLLRQTWESSEQHLLDMALRDYQSIKSTPVPVTVVCSETGRIISQNTASMALIGKLGPSYNNNVSSTGATYNGYVKNMFFYSGSKYSSFIKMEHSYQCNYMHTGTHGTYNTEFGLRPKAFSYHHSRLVFLSLDVLESGHVRAKLTPSSTTVRMKNHVPGDLSFLELLFDGSKVKKQAHCTTMHTLLLPYVS